MTEDQPIMSHTEKLRLIKLGLHPKECVPKPKKYLAKRSAKKIASDKEAKDARVGGEDAQDNWFVKGMMENEPVCAECGMAAHWLLEPQIDPKKAEAYRLMWRASQAHILPKKKKYGFPSLATNPHNRIILFPSWGGFLCGCHGFYDSNWYNASTMKIWPQIVEIFVTKLYPMIPEHEKKNIPEILLNALNG